jgi:hypothetical protein
MEYIEPCKHSSSASSEIHLCSLARGLYHLHNYPKFCGVSAVGDLPPLHHLGYMDLPCCDSVKWIPHLQVACCGLQLDKQLRAPA